MAINTVARVFTLDGQTIKIEPYDKSTAAKITKAIFDANIGLAPQNNGEHILIVVPALNKERREQIVKQVKSMGEDTKARLRKVRQDERDVLKKGFDLKEISEDQKNGSEAMIDDIIKKFNTTVDTMVKAKCDDVMKV